MYEKLYRKLQEWFPDVLFFGASSHPEIALTFDDGPHPRDTPHVLDVLAKHDVTATFFLVGQDVEQHPDIVRQIHERGHQLALHCYRHLPFPMENASTLKRLLDQSRKAIADACDIPPETIQHVRPPYGFFTARTLSLLNAWGYRLVLWNNMPLHFIQPTAWTVKQLVEPTASGSIIVLHDGKGHGAKVAAIVDTIIPMLKAKDFNFITIDDMERNNLNG